MVPTFWDTYKVRTNHFYPRKVQTNLPMGRKGAHQPFWWTPHSGFPHVRYFSVPIAKALLDLCSETTKQSFDVVRDFLESLAVSRIPRKSQKLP